MKQVFTLIAVLCLTSAAFATNGNESNTTSTEPTGSNSGENIAEPETKEQKTEVSSQMSLLNFSMFSFMTVDSVPTISTFGGTDRFRKATNGSH